MGSFFLLILMTMTTVLLTSAMQPLGGGYNSRCVCLQLESRVIPPHSLRSVEILPKGPHCKNTEVIAGLVNGEKICLNPRTTWVKKLIHFIEKKENETKRT